MLSFKALALPLLLLLLPVRNPSNVAMAIADEICDGLAGGPFKTMCAAGQSLTDAVCKDISFPDGIVEPRCSGCCKWSCGCSVTCSGGGFLFKDLNLCDEFFPDGTEEQFDKLLGYCDAIGLFSDIGCEILADPKVIQNPIGTLAETVAELLDIFLEEANVDNSGLTTQLFEKRSIGRVIVLPEIGLSLYFQILVRLTSCAASCVSAGCADCFNLVTLVTGYLSEAFQLLEDGFRSEIDSLVTQSIQLPINEVERVIDASFRRLETACNLTAIATSVEASAANEINALVSKVDDTVAEINDVQEAVVNLQELFGTVMDLIEEAGEWLSVEDVASLALVLFPKLPKIIEDPQNIFNTLTDIADIAQIGQFETEVREIVASVNTIKANVEYLRDKFGSFGDATLQELKEQSRTCKQAVENLETSAEDIEGIITEAARFELFRDIKIEAGVMTYRPELSFSTDGVCSTTKTLGASFASIDYPWLQSCEWSQTVKLPNTFVPFVHIITAEENEVPPCIFNDVVAPSLVDPVPATEFFADCEANLPPLDDPNFTDDCTPDGEITVSLSPLRTGDCGDGFVETRRWSATDAAGNGISFFQTIKVEDTIKPTLNNVPGNITIACDAPFPRIEDSTVTGSDNCLADEDVQIQVSDTLFEGDCPANYTVLRTWAANDRCFNTEYATQRIEVIDVVPPQLHGVQDDTTVECDASIVQSPPLVTASDTCDLDVPVTLVEDIEPGNCKDNYLLSRTWSASDDCSNAVSAQQVLTVRDTTAPQFQNVPVDVTAECDAVPVFDTSVTTTDNCDDAPAFSSGEQRTNGSCDFNYSLARSWESVDDCGNKAVAVQNVFVQDTTPPVLSGVPADETFECDDVDPLEDYVVTSSDNCDDPPPVYASEERIDGNCDYNYSLIRTWESTDQCGNKAVGVQVATVEDTTAPILVDFPEDETVECDSVPEPADVTTEDNCDEDPILSFDEVRVDGACPSNYTLYRTWTTVDQCLNSYEQTQEIIVQDTTAPVISCNTFDLRPSDTNMVSPVTFQPTAVDNCDEDPLVVVESYECVKPDNGNAGSNGKMGNKNGKNRGNRFLREDKACKVDLEGDLASIFITGKYLTSN